MIDCVDPEGLGMTTLRTALVTDELEKEQRNYNNMHDWPWLTHPVPMRHGLAFNKVSV